MEAIEAGTQSQRQNKKSKPKDHTELVLTLFPASIAPFFTLQSGSRGRETRERAIVGNESRTTANVG